MHEEERDVAKYWRKENVAIAFYGIENQIKVDKNMPFRIIGYDGASYRSQLLDKRKNKNYEPDDARIIKHIDAVLKLLSVMTGDNEYESILYDDTESNDEKGQVKTMCEVATCLINKGIKKGVEQGIEQGIEQEKLENARNLLDLLSDEVIAERLKLPLEIVKKLRVKES